MRLKFSNDFDMRDDVRGTLAAEGLFGVVSNITQTAVTVSLVRGGFAAHERDAVSFRNEGRAPVMLRPRQDVELLVPADSFAWNMLRSYVVMASVLAFIAAFGIFLGAGLSVLPKPGAWMRRVKQLFAALFLAAAVHFLLQAFRIAVPTAPADSDWISNPAAAAIAADATGRPVVLALTADWCAACRDMESGVLEEPEVRKALAETIRLRIDCTDVDSASVRATMKAVGARGLPFFAVLE
jgi:thiol-disulfide isomerase/thioredoxin